MDSVIARKRFSLGLQRVLHRARELVLPGAMFRETRRVLSFSAGLRFFPYAGMLPPPWITWRMSWSWVRRTATLCKCWASLAATLTDGMAVTTLLALENQRTLSLKRWCCHAKTLSGTGSPLQAFMCGLHGV